MNSFRHEGATLVASLAVLLALGACDRADDLTARKDASAGTAAPAHTAANAAKVDGGKADSTKADSTRTMGAAAGDKVDDAAITAKVNASLVRDKDLGAIRIDVDTQDGVVTLSGLAPSASAKEHASELARTVPGVHSVNNQLTIRSS